MWIMGWVDRGRRKWVKTEQSGCEEEEKEHGGGGKGKVKNG